MGYNKGMLIGTRIVAPEEAGRWDAQIFQISVYAGKDSNPELVADCARACREVNVPFVIHPVGYVLERDDMRAELRNMALWADRGFILHDEQSPEGGRLSGDRLERFRDAVDELQCLAALSFENATDTSDVTWFWSEFAESITLDIGHVESSGLDSVEFVRSLDERLVRKIEYVHMHRNNGFHGGITDHWPLTPACREMEALNELLRKKKDVSVILEINERDAIDHNLDLLVDFRQSLS